MSSVKFKSMDPYSGLTQLEVYNINSLVQSQNSVFENTRPDISINQNTEFFQIQFETDNKNSKGLPYDN